MTTPTKGHLYIIQSEEGPVKIGVSVDPKSRIARLSATAGRYIVRQFISPPLIGYAELETALHGHFRQQRTAGEWFEIDYHEAVKVAHYLGAAHEPKAWEAAEAYVKGVMYRKRMTDFTRPDRSEAEWNAFLFGLGDEALEYIKFADQVDSAAMIKAAGKLDAAATDMILTTRALGIKPHIPASVVSDMQRLREQMDSDLAEAGLIPTRLKGS
jgi:hypothetical protein